LVSFIVIYQGANVRRAYINQLDLFPGSNTVSAEYHYQPADPNDPIAQDLLTQYLSTTGQVSCVVYRRSISALISHLFHLVDSSSSSRRSDILALWFAKRRIIKR
jgi:hypothetical protein